MHLIYLFPFKAEFFPFFLQLPIFPYLRVIFDFGSKRQLTHLLLIGTILLTLHLSLFCVHLKFPIWTNWFLGLLRPNFFFVLPLSPFEFYFWNSDYQSKESLEWEQDYFGPKSEYYQWNRIISFTFYTRRLPDSPKSLFEALLSLPKFAQYLPLFRVNPIALPYSY